MSPAPSKAPAREVERSGPVVAVHESQAGAGGTIGGWIDETALAKEIASGNPNYNPDRPHPFRKYIQAVIEKAEVPDAAATREMGSVICSEVARLPFVPDEADFDAQIKKTAQRAEDGLDSPMVWTSAAQKLARAALELRREDPDGTRGIAWVNDPLPGEKR